MSVRRPSPVLLVCVCLCLYFGFHAVEGKHGLKARETLAGRIVALKADLGALDAERRRLEREVALLSDEGPDPAYVEELARGLLGYARPGDRVLVEPRNRTASLR